MSARILVVGHNPTNVTLMQQLLDQEGFQTAAATSLHGVDTLLQASEPLDLALVDLTGFDATVWQRCERLRELQIPFLLISPRSVGSPVIVPSGGAPTILTKPLSKAQFVTTVRAMLESDA